MAKAHLARTFDDLRFGRGLDVEKLWPMVSGIQASITRHPGAIMAVTRLKDRHEYTYAHSVAVCGLMIGLARQMGLDPAKHHEIGMAGLLHDIGKARVPTMLLDKPGPLTSEEKMMMRDHARLGYESLMSGDEVLNANQRLTSIVLDACLHHHERLDGSGYPDNQRGEHISLYARMVAICDTYDVATSARVYKSASSPAEALDLMVNSPGRFDPEILSAFSALIGIFPVGSMVRLRSDRLAVVLESPDDEATSPPVCPFFCIQTRQQLPWRRSPPGVDPIIGIELPSRWNLPVWAETRAAILAHFEGNLPLE
ncbi:HD-GYP domain-containing protein [Sphingomonas sp. 28-63-12]|uniref:HD-GYP domain-containing protein n=1 Tax=Sphingomonas sp. 28-63-12 TaxID=1970434 RepID=UPI0035A8B1F7